MPVPQPCSPIRAGGSTVSFRGVSEAITKADTREEALLRAEDALESAFVMYIAAGEPLPASSKVKRGEGRRRRAS